MKINLIIERLFVYFKVNTHSDLARRLGVSATTLSNWKSRNTIDYELLFTKCENINFDWLFMGRGNMYNEYNLESNIPFEVNEASVNYYKDIIKAKEETVQTQKKYITRLEEELEKVKSELEKYEPGEDGQKRKAG